MSDDQGKKDEQDKPKVSKPEAKGVKINGILFKRYRTKADTVNAIRHTGEPQQYNTKHGTETAYDGDYVVVVGERETTQHIPPQTIDGKKVPGLQKIVKAPVLEIMKSEDFEALYAEIE